MLSKDMVEAVEYQESKLKGEIEKWKGLFKDAEEQYNSSKESLIAVEKNLADFLKDKQKLEG